MFQISSPGDVSPVSLDWTATSTTAVEPSTHSSEGGKDSNAIEKTCHEEDLIGPMPRQITRLPPKSGRPNLALIIPLTTARLPVEKSGLSASSDSASDQASVKTTPIATPAHAKRFPTQPGTRAAKPPKKVSLGDELAEVGEVLSGSGEAVSPPRPSEWNTSVHDWAHEEYRDLENRMYPMTLGLALRVAQSGKAEWKTDTDAN